MMDFVTFRDNIIEQGIVDPYGMHHEFVSGMHGQKIDFDLIETGTPLYEEWVDINVSFILQNFNPLPEVILGVANGTNRLAKDVANKFDTITTGLVSEKDPENSKILFLSKLAKEIITIARPALVVVVEDVGTTGSNSVQVATDAREIGAQRVEVVTTWKRRQELERLDEAEIPYRAIIDEPLTTYTPEECRQIGFCALGWEYIERTK
jgi:hypothetical protein